MDLKREMEFKLDENSPHEVIEKYFFRLQELLGASGEKWNRHIAGVQHTHNAEPGAPEEASQAACPRASTLKL